MGATHGRWSGRAVSGVPLLLVVGLITAVVGTIPGDRAGAASKNNPPGNPPGNNGTVKIERDGPMSAGQGNEPHVDGCIFWLEYYGFDEGQTADITFTAQSPSVPKDTVLIADKNVTVSDTPAGGGDARKDYVIAYNLTSAVQDLTAHPKRGYHIKLSSDTKEAIGGAKHKVFWVKCAPQPTTTLRVSKAMEGPAGPTGFGFTVSCNHRPLDTTFTLDPGGHHDLTDVPAGTTCAVTETDNKGAAGTTAVEDPARDELPNDGVVTLSTSPVAVVFTNTFPGEGNTPAPSNDDLLRPAVGGTSESVTPADDDETAVLGATVTAPDGTPQPAAALPRTGADQMPLAATGLWSLAAGSLALFASRRLRRS